MASPLVSVTVPAYNQAGYLRACLDSLWFQDYPDIEIVVVDDGATDDTAQVLEAFLKDVDTLATSYASRYDAATNTLERTHHPVYPREGRSLRVVTHERNRGLAAALNSGVAAATGIYCTYVPCDDLAYPHMLSSLVAALEKDAADFAYADMHIVDDAMHVLRHFKLPDYSFAACFGDWYLCGVCKLYARELHDRFGGYDEALLAHDHELFQRFALGGARFTHVPRALMAVRDHPAHRQVDIHAPTSWNRLLEESKVLVGEARAYLERARPA
jgi:glycosyltransferase involved in cell wall biosynthesis